MRESPLIRRATVFDRGHIEVVLQQAVRYVRPWDSLPFDKLPPHKTAPICAEGR